MSTRGWLLVSVVSAAAQAEPSIVQLSVSNAGCRYDLRLNGVALARADSSDGSTEPVNGWLRAGANVVEAQGAPKEPASACRLEVVVTEVDRATGSSKELARGATDEKTNALKLELESSIDALGPWLSAEPSADEKALKAYAVKLAGLVRAGQVDAWAKEAAPKHEQLAKAFGVELAMLSSGERQGLKDFKKMPALKAADVVVEPLLGGRLHRLRHARHPKALFVLTSKDEERAFEVIVGSVNGALRVVR